jgi:hypothetical protein
MTKLRIKLKEELHYVEKDNKTSRTRMYSCDRKTMAGAKLDSQDRIAETGQPGQDSRNRAAVTGQPGRSG